MFIETETPFSWLREVLVPAIFVLIGSVLGFFATLLTDNRKAKRDDLKAKRAKESFLRAIGMELDALGNQLDSSLYEVKDSARRVGSGGVGPNFAAALRTSVFTHQIGSVRDVDDPLMIEVIHFYSDLGTLEQIFEGVNNHSAEYNRFPQGSDDRAMFRSRITSGLTVLQEQISGFGRRLRALRAKLPPAEDPSTPGPA
jgi:hypothetical protein